MGSTGRDAVFLRRQPTAAIAALLVAIAGSCWRLTPQREISTVECTGLTSLAAGAICGAARKSRNPRKRLVLLDMPASQNCGYCNGWLGSIEPVRRCSYSTAGESVDRGEPARMPVTFLGTQAAKSKNRCRSSKQINPRSSTETQQPSGRRPRRQSTTSGKSQSPNCRRDSG